MGGTQIIVTVRNVSLLLHVSSHISAPGMSQFRIYPFGFNETAMERARKNTVFPSQRIVARLAKKYLASNVTKDNTYDWMQSRLSSLRFQVSKGRTVEQRATFLSALASRTRMKQQ